MHKHSLSLSHTHSHTKHCATSEERGLGQREQSPSVEGTYYVSLSVSKSLAPHTPMYTNVILDEAKTSA